MFTLYSGFSSTHERYANACLMPIKCAILMVWSYATGPSRTRAGVVVVVVNPAGTSQVRSAGGRAVPKTLSDRWHTCPYEDC